MLGPRWRSGCIPIAAIVVAPFLALYAGLDAGLLVAALALATVGWLGLDAARRLDPDRRGRLRALAAVDLLVALACVAVIVIRRVS
jgi:hypothetical protein